MRGDAKRIEALRERTGKAAHEIASAVGLSDAAYRDLEMFEEKQRQELEQFEATVRRLARREKVPGAPTKRKPFFSF